MHVSDDTHLHQAQLVSSLVQTDKHFRGLQVFLYTAVVSQNLLALLIAFVPTHHFVSSTQGISFSCLLCIVSQSSSNTIIQILGVDG